jgi:hypothetical protein
MTLGIRHLGFRFGEERVWYRDLEGMEDSIAESGTPDEEELWGWGYCRRSPGSYAEHVARGFEEVVARVRESGEPPDRVIVCGPFQASADDFLAALEEAGTIVDLGGAPEVEVLRNLECVNVLQALLRAEEWVRAGERRVLILASEKAPSDRARFRPWCFFSDHCLGLLVTGDTEGCRFEIERTVVLEDPDPAEDGSRVFARDLESVCVDRLLAESGIDRGGVDRFLYMNLFEPIAEMKGLETGFEREQLYLELSKEAGHCYGADPFVNLRTFCDGGGEGERFVLCASGRELTGAALVRRREEEAC